jgi:hypothetical protein
MATTIIQSEKDKAAFDKALAAGCTPRWYNGILGWAWHCSCPGDDDSHYIDQQCSVVKWYKS